MDGSVGSDGNPPHSDAPREQDRYDGGDRGDGRSGDRGDDRGDDRNNGRPGSNDHGGTAGGNGSGDGVVGSAAIRPVFLGNLKQSCTTADIASIFERPMVTPNCPSGSINPIPVDRIDMKRGYCFIFLKDATSESDKEQVERYVAELNGMEVENVSNAMRAEFARGDGRIKRKEDDRRKNIQPSETLFVVNFSEETTKREDLQMLFEPYGELVRIDMKRNYAFVQFRSVEEAIRAKDVTDGGKLDQSVLTVEFVARRRGDIRDRRRRDYDRDGRGRLPGDRHGGYDRRYPPGGDRYDRGVGRDYGDRGGRYDDFRRGGRYGRDRSPGGYRGGSPGGYRDGSPGRYRGRSRSRSRSPGRYAYRKRSPPRAGRYEDRGGRHDDHRDVDRRYSGGDYKDSRRSPERDAYHGGRDDRGYRS